MLDSETMEDRCGECGGDGDSCTRVRSNYTDSPSQNGKKRLYMISRYYLTLLLLEPLTKMKIQTRL